MKSKNGFRYDDEKSFLKVDFGKLANVDNLLMPVWVEPAATGTNKLQRARASYLVNLVPRGFQLLWFP